MELPKNYNFEEAEPRIQQHWADKGIFKFKPNDHKKGYSIDTPPPTVSGRMHLGHSFSYSQEDFIARYKRMCGLNVLYPFGTDDNGLPTDKLVEKTKKVRSKDFSRMEYRKLALETVQELKPEFIKDWVKLGMSCDFSLTYSTINEHCQKMAQKSFINLYEKGLVYREESPVAWCTTCQTAIAQAEFENIDMTSHFNDVVFKCAGKDLVIATTRPEMIPACVALFAHPSDKRYSSLKGKFAEVPLFNYEVPILFDESVDLEKGTGLMMVCTFGDKEDVEKWQKYKLPLRVVFTKDGKLNELGAKYSGLSIKDARKEIRADLKEKGFLIRESDITHAVNVHEQCSTEIEFLKTFQWFVRILDKKEELLEAGRRIKWYPEYMRTRYEHWVQNLNYDWCISRQRFYGVPFPVWYDKEGKPVLASENELPVDPSAKSKADLIPEEDVFDTWFISSLSPQIVLEELDTDGLPMSLRPQAHDIIRTWAFYTIVKSLYQEGTIPWKDIAISGFVLDPKGKKMSKSKGNAVAPQDVLKQNGADALRFWAAGSKLGEDLPWQEKDVLTGKKTVTKLWNASRFVLMHLAEYKPTEAKLSVVDKWLLSKLTGVIERSTAAFEKYDYSRCKSETENFFWNTFCDEYLELVKDRLYDEKRDASGAKYTLHVALLDILKLFAPIMPHVTEEIWQLHFKQHSKEESIHLSEWPSLNPKWKDEEAEKVVDAALPIISRVRQYKNENQLSLKTELSELVIEVPKELEKGFKEIEEDLKGVAKAKKITFGKGSEDMGNGVKITITK
ncbi:MAG: valine--tRNA ligase [Candidatus Woesearchaeota archaeon]